MLSPSVLQCCHRLRLGTPGVRGSQDGQHRQRTIGKSMEFAEHRDYAVGDDLRYLDWSAFARLDRFVVKTYQAEADQIYYILVDASTSMAGAKWEFVSQLAASLAYIILLSGDRVGMWLLGSPLTGAAASVPPARGLNMWYRFRNLLTSYRPQIEGQAKSAELERSLQGFVGQGQRPGVVALLSDLLEVGAGMEGVRRLAFNRFKVSLMQVLSPWERQPDLLGDFKLLDMEVEAAKSPAIEVSGSLSLMAAYQVALQKHLEAIEAVTRKYQCPSYQFDLPHDPWPDPVQLENFLVDCLGTRLCRYGWLRNYA